MAVALRTPQENPRVPPQDEAAEESVLGAMLLADTAIGAVAEIVDADDFYKPKRGKALVARKDKSRP